MTKYSLNFRDTIGAWGETGASGAVLRNLYPATIAGLTVGWSASPISQNYTGATNAKRSGRNSINSGSQYFRVDLPLGPGTYRLWLAVGPLSSTANSAFIVRDGAGSAITTVGSTSITGSGSAAASNVLDASGAVIPYNTYISTDGGTYIEFTATSDHVRIERNGVTFFISNVMIEAQEALLEPAVLSTEFGTGVHDGDIYPKEPQGFRFGKITAPVGTQSFSIVAGGTYFAVEVDGSDTWLVATSTRIPNAWSGTVTIRQTSGSQTEDTDFVLTASTLDRPVVGLLGRVSSETLIQRDRVLNVMENECWQGYTGQTFATDQVCVDLLDFVTKFNALSTTGWHRLRLRDDVGDYAGDLTLSGKDWIINNGGVLIEPDSGHDPIFRGILENCNQRGVHWRNTIMIPPTSTSDSLLNVGVASPYAVWRLENLRVGYEFGPEFDLGDWGDWGTFMNWQFCEEITVTNCTFSGLSNGCIVTGGRRMRFTNNTWNLIVRDFHALSTASQYTTPRGVFADNLTYVQIADGTAWRNPDVYTGLTTAATPHGDWLQIRRTGGAAYPTTTAGINGSSSTPWTVGIDAFVPETNRLYTVVSVTGDALIDPLNPPSGTGTGIVSGNVTFDFLMEYTLATEMVILLENNCIMQDGETVNNGSPPAMPNIQFVINSNSGWNNDHTFIGINNICGSSNIRGLRGGASDSTIHAEWNSFVGGAQKSVSNDQATIDGNIVRARHNIVGLVTGQPNLAGTTSLAKTGNVAANFANGAASPNRPGDVMRGSFTDLGSGLGWGYSMTDDDTITASEFRSAMSKQMHHITGAAGAKLREVHTITVDGEDYEIVIDH